MTNNSKLITADDEQLVEAALRGDSASFGTIVERYWKMAIALALTKINNYSEAEDIAQEVFYRIWDKREEYRPTAAFKTFLFAYARNVIRKRQWHKPATTNHLEIMEPSNPEIVVQHKELTRFGQ